MANGANVVTDPMLLLTVWLFQKAGDFSTSL